MNIQARCSSLWALLLLTTAWPATAQQSMCAPVSNNPLVMENLCNDAPAAKTMPAVQKVNTAKPVQNLLTLTAEEMNRMKLSDPPMIRMGDALVFEANRADFVLEIYLSNGKEIVSRPETLANGEITVSGWRKGRAKLDYLESLNQYIVSMKITALHQTSEPLLLRGIKIDRKGRYILELEKTHPGPTPNIPDPPMSYPPDPHVMTASVTMPSLFGREPQTGFLAPHIPSFSIHPMMFQSTGTADPNHYKYNGKELDDESGLYNYGARYYSPALGRFLSPDWSSKPVPAPFANLKDPQTLNLYAYVRNNPTSLGDPDGHAIQLSNDEEKRKQQLAAAQRAVGKDGGKYLYDNVDKKGNHYIGILKGGPTGKGPDFKDLNGAAGKLNSIIQDSRIATVVTVSPGTVVSGPDFSPNGAIGPTTSGLTPGTSRPVNQIGGNEVVYLTSGDPGKLPSAVSSTNRDAPLTLGDVLSHELGHVFARWFGGDSNNSSVQMENDTRRVNGEPTRTGHDEARDVQPH